VTHLRLALFLIGLLLAAGGSAAHAESGTASVYGSNGGETASGEPGNSSALTAAHRTLPFGTMVQDRPGDRFDHRGEQVSLVCPTSPRST
jgi:hypothetical protein